MRKIAYGNSQLEFVLPGNSSEIKSEHFPALGDIGSAIASQLIAPVDGSRPLSERVRGGDRVVIVISDITRAWVRNDLLLPPLLDHLNDLGISDRDITLLVALGSHRRHHGAELRDLVGAAVFDRVSIVEHDCHRNEGLVYLGDTSRQTPVRINRLAAEADGLILTGGIVYHLMAGFGGGRKSILPGIAAYETIQANHRLLLDETYSAGIGSGCTTGNVLHEDMMEACRLANPAFLINVILNEDGQIAQVVGGNWDSAWELGCRTVEQRFGIPITERGDLVIASPGGFPKDINLYQSSKALENAYHAVKPGGAIVLAAECRDGGGSPEFFDWFAYRTIEEMRQALLQDFTVPGYIAYHIRRIAQKVKTIAVSSLSDDLVAKTGMIPAGTMQEALEIAYRHLETKSPNTLIMPHGSVTVPLPANGTKIAGKKRQAME